MTQQIIALSGKKQSGKTSAANAVLGWQLQKLGLVNQWDLTDKGELYLFDLMRQEVNGIFDINLHTEELDEFLEKEVFPYIKLYSFADQLKQKVCIDILGLTHKQCYGTDEDKNSETHLKWEHMPGIIMPDDCYDIGTSFDTPKGFNLLDDLEENPNTPEENNSGYFADHWKDKPFKFNNRKWMLNLILHEPGNMTAREVLQYVGTEIFRKMYTNVWVDSTIRQIKKDNSVLVIITDCRFPNEVEGTQKEGGKVIHFTRDIYKGKDKHDSETALDDYTGFDGIIDNCNMSLIEQTQALQKVLTDWNII